MSERKDIDELVAGYEDLSKRTEELQARTEVLRLYSERLNKEVTAEIEELSAENEQLRGDLAAWENKEPLSPDPERVQLRWLVKENAKLRATMAKVVEELDAAHVPMWIASTGGFTRESVEGKQPVGCMECYPQDGSWPCISRMLADDLLIALK